MTKADVARRYLAETGRWWQRAVGPPAPSGRPVPRLRSPGPAAHLDRERSGQAGNAEW